MKKTLMALSLALCATFAFAQMPKNARVHQVAKVSENQAVTESFSSLETQRQESFKGSIFTKAPLMTEDFSSTSTAYTVGRATGAGYQVAPYAQWQRVPDTTQNTLAGTTVQQWFPVLFGAAAGGQTGYRSLNGFDSQTPMNGIMVMSMQDQIQGWGGPGTAGKFDSWIAFDAVQPNSNSVYDLSFYQFMRKFNAVDDSCLVEYSPNGTTWNSILINRAGIDVAVNGSLRGEKVVALPVVVGTYTDLYLRIRYKSDTNVGGAYGYFWMLDDVSLDSAATNRWTISQRKFWDGGYHIVPQGMGGNSFVWSAQFRNTGAINQTNVLGTVKSSNGTTLAQTQSIATLVPDAVNDTFAYIDPQGRIANGTGDYLEGSTTIYGTAGTLPSTTAGEDSIFVSLTSDSIQAHLDTIKYIVNSESDGSRIWGRDNGHLCGQTYWCHGIGASGLWSGCDEVDIGEQGYTLAVMYGAPANVPSNWVIRGVEIVPSSMTGYAIQGAQLDPIVWYDSTDVSAGSTSWYRVATGASTYTVNQNDINTFDIGYQDYGTYSTIRINFPDQPALQSNKRYWIGYQMAQAGTFTPAIDRTYYFRPSDSTSEALPNHWNRRFGTGNAYNVFVMQPSADQYLHLAGSVANGTPMIRMIVGPYRQIPTYNINWTVRPNGGGEVYDMTHGTQPVGGTTVTANQGSTIQFGIQPDIDNGYYIDSLIVDNVAIDLNSDPNWLWDGDNGYYDIANIQAAHNCVVVFKQDVSINHANSAVVKVQPNPATTTANLTIEGVNGDVNYALIDINGRVISEKVINANATEQINLQGLARGTYFVRITNSNFTKVEKLIVR